MSTREHGPPSAAVRVEDMTVAVRGERVILDRDLARLYDVTTKALNQAVKRNPGRFPSEFMFRLTFQEVADLKSQSVTSRARANRSQVVTGSEKHRNSRFPPYAFTEHGALMASNVLRSPQAVDVSVFVVRALSAFAGPWPTTPILPTALTISRRNTTPSSRSSSTRSVD
jgi:hypothetical protein